MVPFLQLLLALAIVIVAACGAIMSQYLTWSRLSCSA